MSRRAHVTFPNPRSWEGGTLSASGLSSILSAVRRNGSGTDLDRNMSEATALIETEELIQVLHVDDRSDFADLTATFLERADDRFTVETASSPDGGLERIGHRPP